MVVNSYYCLFDCLSQVVGHDYTSSKRSHNDLVNETGKGVALKFS